MSKKFTYTKTTGHYFCQYSDEWEEDGVEFDYEVEDKDLLPVLADLIYDAYFGDCKSLSLDEDFKDNMKKKLLLLIEENDMISFLAENYEDALKEVFYEQAMEWYRS